MRAKTNDEVLSGERQGVLLRSEAGRKGEPFSLTAFPMYTGHTFIGPFSMGVVKDKTFPRMPHTRAKVTSPRSTSVQQVAGNERLQA